MPKKNDEYSQLEDLLKDFHQLTRIRVSYWNCAGMKCIMAPPSGNSEFCSELRKIPQLDSECRRCDQAALMNAPREGQGLYQFRCAAGLNEYVYPVFYNRTLLGYFMYGQVREQARDLAGAQARETLCRDHGLDPEYISSLYERLPIVSQDEMHAAGRMLAALARYAYLNGLMWNMNAPLPLKIERYMSSYFMQPISIQSACETLNVSRSTLSHTIQSEMHSTFVGLLNRQRIDNVIKCLDNGQSITDAAYNSGFQSVNYMIRIFRRYQGVTPAQYRRSKADQA